MRIFPACSKSRQIEIDTGQSIVLLKGKVKVCLCLSSDYLQVNSFYSSPRCSVLILFQMVTTSNWHEIMNSVSHVKRLQVCVLYKTRLPVLSKWFCRLEDPFDILRSFSNDDELRRREAIGLLSKTTSLQVHHAFLYFSLPLLHDYAVEMPNFMFCRGREPKTTTFLFFSLSAIKFKAGRLHF